MGRSCVSPSRVFLVTVLACIASGLWWALLFAPADSAPIPEASFRMRPGAPLVSVPAAVVRLRVTYKDPITSPVTYAPEEEGLTATVKTTAQALKSVTVKWVVLSGLRKLGFPGDSAVLNLPMAGHDGDPLPFVTETGGYTAG